MTPKVGEFWQDNDPRYPRTVEIMAVDEKNGWVKTQTTGSNAVTGKRPPVTRSNIARFGKAGRGGFTRMEVTSGERIP